MVRIKTYGLAAVADKQKRREALRRVTALKQRIAPYLDELLHHETTPRIVVDGDLQPQLVGNIPYELREKIANSMDR